MWKSMSFYKISVYGSKDILLAVYLLWSLCFDIRELLEETKSLAASGQASVLKPTA